MALALTSPSLGEAALRPVGPKYGYAIDALLRESGPMAGFARRGASATDLLPRLMRRSSLSPAAGIAHALARRQSCAAYRQRADVIYPCCNLHPRLRHQQAARRANELRFTRMRLDPADIEQIARRSLRARVGPRRGPVHTCGHDARVRIRLAGAQACWRDQ